MRYACGVYKCKSACSHYETEHWESVSKLWAKAKNEIQILTLLCNIQ
jgi:hypothetical protein